MDERDARFITGMFRISDVGTIACTVIVIITVILCEQHIIKHIDDALARRIPATQPEGK